MMEAKMDADALRAFLKRDFPQVGPEFSLDQVTEEGVIARLAVTEQHLRPGGTVSGPAMFALADVAMYLAILSRLGPVALAVTTNCSIDFMRKPQAGADVSCHARILKLGRVLAVGDAMIFSAGHDAPVARANLTYAIPPK